MSSFFRPLHALSVSSFLMLGLMFVSAASAQETPAKPAKKPAAGRLPAHFKDLVTAEQKNKIYAVQSKYKDKLDALAADVKKLQEERDTEIEALLDADQKAKLAKSRAEASAKRATAAEAIKKADAATAAAKTPDAAVPAATTVPKTK